MIYDINNLKVLDYVRADDNVFLCHAIMPKQTMARVCYISKADNIIGLEFQTPCSFAGGHSCNDSGRPGYCAWIPTDYLANHFSYVPIIEDRACECIKGMINGIYGSPIQRKAYEKFQGFGGHTWLQSYDEWIKEKTNSMYIDKVIFNDPATIVFWKDGSKTVVKAENEPFDKEKGLAMAISKKALGNKGNYYDTFKKHVPDDPIVYHHKLTGDETVVPVPKDVKYIKVSDSISYFELPDHLRLIYQNGKYAGWCQTE